MSASKTNGRPIGAKVITVAEIVERLGGRQRAAAVADEMPGENVTNVHKYLRRAVSYGLMTSHSTRPMVFEVVDDWRRFLRAAPDPGQIQLRALWRRPVSFVFDLGLGA